MNGGKLGQRVYEKYSSFLGNDPKNIFAYFCEQNRSVVSGYADLRGMFYSQADESSCPTYKNEFPNIEKLFSEKGINKCPNKLKNGKQNFPYYFNVVNYKKRIMQFVEKMDEQNKHQGWKGCPKLYEMKANAKSDKKMFEAVLNFNKTYGEKLVKYINDSSKTDFLQEPNPNHLFDFYFEYVKTYFFNQENENDLSEFYQKSGIEKSQFEADMNHLRYLMYEIVLIGLEKGKYYYGSIEFSIFSKMIVEHIDRVLSGKPYPKFVILSAHDGTILEEMDFFNKIFAS